MTSYELIKEIVDKVSKKEELMKSLASPVKAFQFSPQDAEHYFVKLGESKIVLEKGDVVSPAATISATDSLLSDMFQEKIDPIQAFMSGKLKVSGDIFGAQRITEVLKKAKD